MPKLRLMRRSLIWAKPGSEVSFAATSMTAILNLTQEACAVLDFARKPGETEQNQRVLGATPLNCSEKGSILRIAVSVSLDLTVLGVTATLVGVVVR